MTWHCETYVGHKIVPLVSDVARLRMTVFREWPYLYEGVSEYEESYLSNFAASESAVVVAAMVEGAIIGVATGAPLADHTDAFAPLVAAAGYDPKAVFYCGESVLLGEWRGKGIGHAFFDQREAHARRLGTYTHTAFCAVVREDRDPRRPANYRPLDPFWIKRGYNPVPGLVGSYRWKEIGQSVETDHPMQFWVRAL